MNISKMIYLGAFSALALTSCSDDDDNNNAGGGLDGTANLYATSHADGNVTRYNLINGEVATFNTAATDAEGIFYDSDDDSFNIAARGAAPTSVQGYLSVSDILDFSTDLSVDISGPSVLTSARDLAVNDDFYVVADNANPQGRFFIFEKDDNTFSLRNTITVDFAVWGIEFVGSDLYAVVDNSSDLAVFTNFLDNSSDATLDASKRITVEGIVRTHGLDYDGGTMIMTDIAAAADGDFDTDGGFHVITDFDSKFAAVENGGTLAVSNQIRFAGATTLLGNPVNVVYDAETDVAYIAELANGGGRVLAFTGVSSSAGGNAAPSINNSLAGVSSLYLYKD